ncbi:dipeptide/oligopeptide/nickel ABC transporter ATP-binding protein [Marinilactibacillus sp. 15R]|uniref:Peptide/nickel transport system ATP-binding protein n=1 Tax=Marinilactibacillus piezotolerans TaxID=258723 RepID=A0A1I3VRC0_9LACT|nr:MULTISPECIES: ABC transporter ATP-binding protein [Marinilactibacillus]API89274.1 dipeptide/oligopeptide/nickel ABC transporter ATP-binding protein [Marinilactibacillus sp. 15R]SFJ96817.1 peptide/nickel transport system ATP-binding protein [Marinilactibacillus piezotolerans]
MAVERNLLEINNLKTGFRFGEEYHNAVDGVSLTLKKNEILAIVGESGCGKSTLATSIMGLHDPKNTQVSGEIIYKDLNLIDLNEKLYNRIRGNDIGMIFQDPLGSLNPLMTIYRQIAEALVYHSDMNEKQIKERVLELLNQVGIPRPEQIMKAYPHELSGGMRQRVVIAIALANKPPIIIADEPTTALDVTIQAQILDLMIDIQDETGSGIILITHDLGVVAETADRVAVMYAGQIVEEAPVDVLFRDPKHPYTRSLLNSIPHELEEGEELHVIHGTVPSLQKLPRKGDRFRPRIPWIPDEAFDENPELTEIAPNHKVRGNSWKHFHFEGEEK